MVMATPTKRNTSVDALRTDWERATKLKADAHAAMREAERVIQQLYDSTIVRDETPTIDSVARLEAQLALPAAKAKLQEAQLVAARADRHEADARAAVRAAEEAEADAERREIHMTLLPILRDQVRPLVDRLAALNLAHPHPGVNTWGALQSADAKGAFEPQLDHTIKSAREYGWFEDDRPG